MMLQLFLLSMQNASEGASVITQKVMENESFFNSKELFNIGFQLFITVIGFCFALWSQRIHDDLKDKKDTSELKKLLKGELQGIISILKLSESEWLEVQPLKTPLWESVINTGQLSLLDFSTREKLFRIYNKINEYNSWKYIYTNYFFEKGQKNLMIQKELNMIKRDLLGDNAVNNGYNISKLIEIL